MLTDHEPLISVTQRHSSRFKDRETRQLDYFSQFFLEFRHIGGTKNRVAWLFLEWISAVSSTTPNQPGVYVCRTKEMWPTITQFRNINGWIFYKCRWDNSTSKRLSKENPKKRSKNPLKSATTDRDAQFEYSLFQSTMNFLICGRHRTISHHPAANEINGTISWTN